MRYRVAHKTEYRYGEAVPLCHNVIRLRPRDTADQMCHRWTMSITPTPAARRELVDFFGNHATWISLQEPHAILRINAESEVEVREVRLPSGVLGPAWETVPGLLRDCTTNDLHGVRQFCFDSAYVKAEPRLAEYARPSFPQGAPLLQCVLDLTRRIVTEFTFDTRATSIGTPVLEVLTNRRGVCQDFAHLQIGCLRSLGLPARYVSGYILTRPPPGQRRLVGADASHAWISAYIPSLGWIDFDPTNGVMPSIEHVTIGWGRDYDDISPLKGVLIGGHRHAMSYGVDVEPLDLPPVPPAETKPPEIRLTEASAT